MIKVKDLINMLRRVDGEASITMIVPYGVPTYVEEVYSEPNVVSLGGKAPYGGLTDELVGQFDAKHRAMILAAMEFMQQLEQQHDLAPANYRQYIRSLIARVRPQDDEVATEDQWDEDDGDWDFGDRNDFSLDRRL